MIHQNCVIDSKSRISSSAKIGPYTVIGPKVEIGNDVEIHSHVNISGNTIVGDETIIFPFASIGNAPQDLKYKGEKTKLEIGKNNIIREYVTINPGTSNVKKSESSALSLEEKSLSCKYTSFFLDICILQSIWFAVITSN